MIVDIFLRTYPRDYQWLPYLWRSIDKHVTGYRQIVIVHPQGVEPPPPPDLPHIFEADPPCLPHDYYGQQVAKLRAHQFTDADVIAYIDSDCVFIAPVDFQTYERPLLVTPWDRVGEAVCWLPPTREILGFEPPYEAMRGFPFVFPRWLIEEVWQHIGGLEGVLRTLTRTNALSEFNAIGNYAVAKHPDKFKIQNTETEPLPPTVVRQFWSYHGVDHPEVVAELERLGLR